MMTDSPLFRVAVFAAAMLIHAAAVPSAQAQTSPSFGAASGAGFGGVAAAGMDELFVGSAPVGWQTGDEPPGTVYRYVRGSDGQWTETSSIMASDGQIGDDFGRTVVYHNSGSTETLVVGAPGVNAAYVFEKSDGAWSQTGKLTPSTVDEGTEFGGAYARAGFRTGNIAVDGNRIAVTAYGADASLNGVHVFLKSGNRWSEETILKPVMGEGETEAPAGFAWAVAAGSNTIFVGANAANERRGAVHIYSLSDGGWVHTGNLDVELDDAAAFGHAITYDGSSNTLYVGAPGHGGFGAAIGFVSAGMGAWEESVRFESPQPGEAGGRQRSGFGGGIAASAGRLLIGARGAAFVASADNPLDLAELTPSDDRSRPGFGTGLALNNGVAVVGSPSADYEEGISTVYEYMVARGDTDSGWYPVSTLASDISFLSSISGEQVDCDEGTAEMFACNNVDMVSFLSAGELTSHRGVKMTDIWGWEDPVTGKEWVVLGRTDGTAFVDISDPSNPLYVGQLYRTEGSPGSAWRDVKVYKDHAFVVADGADQHGVQIFDLTQLRNVNPADMPVTFEETAHYDGTASTHNIVINEETGFAYAVGNRSGGKNPCGGQLHIFDVRDPANPQFAGCFSSGQGGTHDAQCVIYRGADQDYNGREICFASNGSSFVIGDVTNKDSTITIANTSYPNQAYTHQGWLDEQHNYFYMNDELDEMNGSAERTRTLIWDVSDLDDPQLVKEFFLDSKASDHNLYIRDNFMYQSNYQAGLRIMDISDPVNPVEVGNFDTAPYAEDAAGFGGSWSNYPYFKSGLIAVSSRAEGLFILKKRPVDM